MTLREETIMVCHDTAKFSGYKHFGSGDKMTLVCFMIWPDHVSSFGRARDHGVILPCS